VPFNPRTSCRMLESSLSVYKMFESEDDCKKDGENELRKKSFEEFAEKRESLRIVIKKTQHLGKDYLNVV
jgi:hypothetical protein